MITKDSYPFFVFFLDIDPTKIDINVHPAKHEIKFEDEKLAYTFVNLGVKHALGAYSVSPTLDFNQEDHLNRNGTFEQQPRTWLEITQHAVQTRDAKKFAPPTTGFKPLNEREEHNVKNWQKAYETVATQKVSGEQSVVVSNKI